jgi:PAS domain S-box-containing protein
LEKAQILVVEDDSIVAMELQNGLQSLGYAVAAVASYGEEAIEKAAETRPDLVLMDIRLKGNVDGVETAEEIRVRFDIPVIYLTAYADENTLQRAKVTEPYGYMVKPFEERELYSTIEITLYKHEMERQLRKSEQWLATTLRSLGDAAIATDRKGLVTFMNPAAEALTGWKEEDAQGKNVTEVFYNEETSKATRSPVEKAFRAGVVVGLANHILIARDGRKIPIDGNVAPIRDNKGDTIGSVLVFCDITERKRAEEALKKAHDELERRVEERTAELVKSNEQLRREITERKKAEEELKQSLVKLQKTLEGTIHALASAVEMRDPYTAGHQRRVTQLACAIAQEMGLPEEQIEGIHMAGQIHDIGKINVPAEILSKPGTLNGLEFGLIKTHPLVGHDILNGSLEFPWPVAQIVLQHHERMDGSGYPQGLSGEEILLEARILAVADVVEAMASHRPYRSARGIDEALEEISRNRGILYDPEVVDACLKLFTEKGFAFE